jgi:hypothetical protein
MVNSPAVVHKYAMKGMRRRPKTLKAQQWLQVMQQCAYVFVLINLFYAHVILSCGLANLVPCYLCDGFLNRLEE